MKIRTLHCSLVPRTSENTAWYTVYTLFVYVHNCKSQENNLVHVTWKQGYIRCYSSSSFSETVELDLGQKKSSTVSLRRSVDSIVFIVVGLLRFIFESVGFTSATMATPDATNAFYSNIRVHALI